MSIRRLLREHFRREDEPSSSAHISEMYRVRVVTMPWCCPLFLV